MLRVAARFTQYSQPPRTLLNMGEGEARSSESAEQEWVDLARNPPGIGITHEAARRRQAEGVGGGPVVAGRRGRRVRGGRPARHAHRAVPVAAVARPVDRVVRAALGPARRRPRPGPRRRRPPGDRPARPGVDQHQAPPHRQALPRRRRAGPQRPPDRVRAQGPPRGPAGHRASSSRPSPPSCPSWPDGCRCGRCWSSSAAG